MARKTFLYYLFDKDKKPLYVDANGHVLQADPVTWKKPNGQPAHLQYSPQGWQDTLIKYARNIKYWGLFRDFTIPMKFVGDGATILRNLSWTQGPEAICYMGILRLDQLTTPYRYESYYLSELNFTKYKETLTGVNIEALEGGLSKLFKANEGTVYEIPVQADVEHVNVKMDGRKFDYTRVWEFVTDQQVRGDEDYYGGIVETSMEGNPADEYFASTMQAFTAPYPNTNWFYRTLKAQDVTIKVNDLQIFYNKTCNPVIRVDVVDNVSGAIASSHDLLAFADSHGLTGQTKYFNKQVTFNVPANHSTYLKTIGGSPTDHDVQYTIHMGKMTQSYEYIFTTTYVAGLYFKTLLKRLLEKATGGVTYSVLSDWLTSKLDMVVTSGDCLRRLPGAVIKTSLAECFQALKCLPEDEAGTYAGLGIEDDKLRVERIEHFFTDEVIVDLGEIDNPELTVAEDLMINTIKVGQKANDYQDVNGRDEVNQGEIWTTPITKVIKEFDLISPYRKDSLGAELARINFDNKKSTDSSGDNDTWILNTETVKDDVVVSASFSAADQGMTVESTLNFTPGMVIDLSGTASNNGNKTVDTVTVTGGTQLVKFTTAVIDEAAVVTTIDYLSNPCFKLYRPAFTVITGIPHPDTVFNVQLRPKLSLLGAGGYLHGLMPYLDTQLFKLGSADKNKELVTELGGVTITEKEDIQIGGLNEALFWCYYLDATTKVPVNVIALIKNKPYGRITLTVEGEPFSFYLMDGGIKPATRDGQKWKMLSVFGNDFSKFKKAS